MGLTVYKCGSGSRELPASLRAVTTMHFSGGGKKTNNVKSNQIHPEFKCILNSPINIPGEESILVFATRPDTVRHSATISGFREPVRKRSCLFSTGDE